MGEVEKEILNVRRVQLRLKDKTMVLLGSKGETMDVVPVTEFPTIYGAWRSRVFYSPPQEIVVEWDFDEPGAVCTIEKKRTDCVQLGKW
jgi:hypothetical protein